MKTYLVTPKALLKMFTLAADRAYYSSPVSVVLFSEIAGRQLMAVDAVAGRTFPVSRKHIIREYQLTNAQRAAIETRTVR